MEAEAADSQLAKLEWEGIGRRPIRDRLVEGGVEDRDVGELRERTPGLADRRERRCVVQRRELGQACELELDRVVDQHRLAEARTAVHHAMGDRLDVIRRLGE